MSKQQSYRMKIKDILRIYSGLNEIFKGEVDKVAAWLETPNLNFGGSTPDWLMKRGLGYKVLQFIEGASKYDWAKPKEWVIDEKELDRLDMKEFDKIPEGCVRVRFLSRIE